ncbi:MAG: acyl carrier protein [Sphingomonadales bacterium]|nr:MAG: acyl carrier protein [Sphingomonadales bacterium]TNF01867.1 MAG: acyl carrier protein [Sphingomonadales bacterium]
MRAEPLKDDALPSSLDETLRATLQDVLGLSAESVATFGPETELFGALPELDSMAVATLLTEIEDRFSILIDDDDIDGETFETFGTLTAFIKSKLPGQA